VGGEFPVVVLACSTGGLDALSVLLGRLPPEFPAAVLVVRHMAPNAPGMLPEILNGRTALKVTSATTGAVLEPGSVLVGPPGEHMLARADGTLLLIPAGEAPPYRPSADLLLATLAVTAGPRVIAVVLSGGGNDAATGATAVHSQGGLVIAADPESARISAMPQASIDRGNIVDQVVPTDDIADLLVALTTVDGGSAGRRGD
jgi:two-component system, chemotaxis family, protein-glutamate methylesterase/glutaminase